MSPLRWTCKSTASCGGVDRTAARQRHDRRASARGAGLQPARHAEAREGAAHPDRNAQFEHINATADAFTRAGSRSSRWTRRRRNWSGISRMPGASGSRTANPSRSASTTFPATPGQGDPVRRLRHGANEGWVSVGIDHDTAEFAVATIRRWWTRWDAGLPHGHAL